MSTPSPRALAGQLVVSGFEATTLPPRTARALAAGERAGCILFKRNLPSLEVGKALTAAIRAATPAADPPPLLAIDEEGGRVSRLPAPFRKLPPMRRLGELGDAELVRRAGHAVAAVLLEHGFNLDFAPILDVDSNPDNPIIGDRSFSRDAAEVARLGLAFARGLGDGGVLACGKHFPGHGDTDLDSHLALPHVGHPRARLDAVELLPFQAAAAAGIDSIMSAHVVIEALEPGLPATLSRRAMTELLRSELGFRGVLVSDDLEMRAVADRYAVEESAVAAVEAGCDLVLVCKEEELADRAVDALAAAIADRPAFARRAEEAFGRVAGLRRRAAELARAAAARVAPSMDDVHAELEAAHAARRGA